MAKARTTDIQLPNPSGIVDPRIRARSPDVLGSLRGAAQGMGAVKALMERTKRKKTARGKR